jgi:excisionase family DNA binding protein
VACKSSSADSWAATSTRKPSGQPCIGSARSVDRGEHNGDTMVQQHTKNSSESNRGFIDVLLNVSDVATFLGVAAKTVHKLVREKKLACVQVTSRDRRFTHEQIQEYIQSQSTSVRVDKKEPRPVSSAPKKGGAKSIGVSGTDLRKEMRSW